MLIPNLEVIGQFTAIYNYLRCLRSNDGHSGFLLPISILTISSSSACHFASADQISSKSDYRGWSCDVIAIFKMAASHHVAFGVGKR